MGGRGPGTCGSRASAGGRYPGGGAPSAPRGPVRVPPRAGPSLPGRRGRCGAANSAAGARRAAPGRALALDQSASCALLRASRALFCHWSTRDEGTALHLAVPALSFRFCRVGAKDVSVFLFGMCPGAGERPPIASRCTRPHPPGQVLHRILPHPSQAPFAARLFTLQSDHSVVFTSNTGPAKGWTGGL